MGNRFDSIKAQLDGAADQLDRDEERLRAAIGILRKGYQEIISISGSEDPGLRLAKKIAEEYAQFDVDDFHL